MHPALRDHGPYIAVLVELPHAGNVRMLGNLLGDPRQEVTIGAPVEAVFEPHDDADHAVHAGAVAHGTHRDLTIVKLPASGSSVGEGSISID